MKYLLLTISTAIVGLCYAQTTLPKKEHKAFTKAINKTNSGNTKQARILFNEYLNDASGFVKSYHKDDKTNAKCFILSLYGISYVQFKDNQKSQSAKSYYAYHKLKSSTIPYHKEVFEIKNHYFDHSITLTLENNFLSFLDSELNKIDTLEWNIFLKEYRIIELVNSRYPIAKIDSLIKKTRLNREFGEILKKHPDFNPEFRNQYFDFSNYSKRISDDFYFNATGGKYERKMYGTYWFDNGDKYEGDFGFQLLPLSPNLNTEDIIAILQGKGVRKTIKMDNYAYFYGRGKYTWKSGNFFEGNFIYGKMNGFGTLNKGGKESEVYYLLGKRVSLDDWSRPINVTISLEPYFTKSIPIYGTNLENNINRIRTHYSRLRPEVYYLPKGAKSHNDYYQKYKIYRKEGAILIFNSLQSLILIHEDSKSFTKIFSAQKFNLEDFTFRHFSKTEWSNDYYHTKEHITKSVNITNPGYFISYKSPSSNYTRVTVLKESNDSLSFDVIKEFKDDMEFIHRKEGTKYYYSLSEKPRVDISDYYNFNLVTACKVYAKGFNKHLLRISKERNNEIVEVNLIDLNEMRDNLFKKNLSHFYAVGNNTYFRGTSWKVAEVKILSDGSVMTLIELEHNFSREDPRFNFNIPQSYKEHIAILFNKELELQGAKNIPIGEHIVILENGNWLTIFNDVFRIIKYGKNFDVLEDKILGVTQGNNNEIVENVFLDGKYLYATGISEIKEDYSKPNPILWKVEIESLNLSSYKVYGLEDDLKCFGVSNGLLYRINSRYKLITSDNFNMFD